MPKTLTTEEFIKRAILIHGDIYGYWKVYYIDSYTDVLIYCKKCKKYFKQRTNNHLLGRGCQTCGQIKSVKKRTKTTDEFIKEAINIHGDDYCYDNVLYINAKKEEYIYCKTCKKLFTQTQQKRDKIKRDYCKNNNIKLIEIQYWKKKNIEQIIKEEILNEVKQCL